MYAAIQSISLFAVCDIGNNVGYCVIDVLHHDFLFCMSEETV